MSSNYPIVRLTDGSGHVYYARTFNWSSTGVATGNATETTQFAIPANLPSVPYSLVVIANGIASAPVSFTAPLSVIASTPADGSVLATTPTSYQVTFSGPITPASLQASDLQVNSIAASGVTLSADDTTATFTFNADPVTSQGLQTITMAAGAVSELANPAVTLNAFTANFRYDLVTLQVVSTTPSIGSVFTLPGPFTYDVNFNEPIDPASITTASLSLSGIPGATVTGVTVLPGNTTAEFTLSGMTTEGVLTATIAAGAVTDVLRQPGPDVYRTILDRRGNRSAAHAAYAGGAVRFAHLRNERIRFYFPRGRYRYVYDQRQPRAVVQCDRDANDQHAATDGHSPRSHQPDHRQQHCLVQSEPAVIDGATSSTTSAGTYSITVSGAGATTGSYTVLVILNASTELEGLGPGNNNNSLATAQDISVGAVSLGNGTGAEQLAVVGAIDAQADPYYYSFPANAGEIDSIGLAAVKLAGGMTLSLYDPNGALVATGSGGATNLSQVIGNVALAQTGTYYVAVTGTANTNFSLVVARNAAFDTEPNDSFATAQSLLPGQGALGALTTGDEDWYAVNVSGGQLLSLTTYTPSYGPAQFANTLAPTIQLYNPTGTLVATGTLLADGHNESLGYIASSPGTYRIRVLPSGATKGEYYFSAAQLSADTVRSVAIDNGTQQRSHGPLDQRGLCRHDRHGSVLGLRAGAQRRQSVDSGRGFCSRNSADRHHPGSAHVFRARDCQRVFAERQLRVIDRWEPGSRQRGPGDRRRGQRHARQPGPRKLFPTVRRCQRRRYRQRSGYRHDRRELADRRTHWRCQRRWVGQRARHRGHCRELAQLGAAAAIRRTCTGHDANRAGRAGDADSCCWSEHNGRRSAGPVFLNSGHKRGRNRNGLRPCAISGAGAPDRDNQHKCRDQPAADHLSTGARPTGRAVRRYD